MRGNILKRAAAVVVAVCVGVTFIPLAGEYAFADENDNPVIEETIPDAVPAEEATEPSAEQTEAEAVTEEPAEQTAEPAAEPAEEPAVQAAEELEVKNGLITEDGVTYYYVNDAKQSGFQTIDGALYYFDPGTFAMKTGTVAIDGALYYFFSNGQAVALTNAWFKGDDSSAADRYALGNGMIAMGAKGITTKESYKTKVKVNKKKGKKAKYKTVTKTRNVTKVYWFNTATGKKDHAKGFFDYNGKSYYCKGNGVLATGWQALKRDGKLNGYYFDKSTGAMAKGTTIGYLKIPANGKLHEAYALGIKKLNSTKWTLRQAYKNSYKIRYQGRWWRQKTAEQYAMKGFKKNKGNCFVMASTFYIQAKLLGYNVRQIKGKVAYRAPHSWTQIKVGSKWKVYDPNFRNETGRNGWNIYYGKKGTWRYTNYSVFQN